MNIPIADEFGNINITPSMHVSLACDHRIVDGAESALFLSEIKHVLETFGEE
jgi:pyruvate/2-oxoglutarate dehydrogenase complex dihydrolipoamide acyltransferase (E2) component